MERLGRNITSK
ncbi:hypothetical protein ABFA07_002942 [Porites harrisoni]